MIIVGEEDALFLTGIFLFDVVKNFLQRCCGFLIGESKIPNDNLVRYTGLYTGILETGETAVGRNIFFGRVSSDESGHHSGYESEAKSLRTRRGSCLY